MNYQSVLAASLIDNCLCLHNTSSSFPDHQAFPSNIEYSLCWYKGVTIFLNFSDVDGCHIHTRTSLPVLGLPSELLMVSQLPPNRTHSSLSYAVCQTHEEKCSGREICCCLLGGSQARPDYSRNASQLSSALLSVQSSPSPLLQRLGCC